jgi:hypothetical protein
MPITKVQNKPTAKEKAGAHKAQKPIVETKPVRTFDSLKAKRINQSDLYQKLDLDQKKTLQELAEVQEVFYITNVKLVNTKFGENYVFTCVGKDLGEFFFWATRDDTRDTVYELVKREKRNAEAVGPFFIEQLEPKQKGLNGYCRIAAYDTDEDMPF